MSKYCPLLNKSVVYLECLDCEDKKICSEGKVKKELHQENGFVFNTPDNSLLNKQNSKENSK